MPPPSNHTDRELAHLRQRLSLSLAMDEVAISALSESLERNASSITVEEKAEMERAIRAHHIGILKQRAVMGALGIDV